MADLDRLVADQPAAVHKGEIAQGDQAGRPDIEHHAQVYARPSGDPHADRKLASILTETVGGLDVRAWVELYVLRIRPGYQSHGSVRPAVIDWPHR